MKTNIISLKSIIRTLLKVVNYRYTILKLVTVFRYIYMSRKSYYKYNNKKSKKYQKIYF